MDKSSLGTMRYGGGTRETCDHARAWSRDDRELGFRDVEDLLAERGIIVSYETIRQWCRKFGSEYARSLKKKVGRQKVSAGHYCFLRDRPVEVWQEVTCAC